MKKFFTITGYLILGVILCLYLAFLFYLPRKIDLNTYKPDIQKLVKDNTNLTLDYDDLKLTTSPFLEAGIKTGKISVNLPDGSEVLSANSFKGKVFLPSLLLRSVRISNVEIDTPKLNIEILNNESFKVGKVYEDIVNKQRKERLENPTIEAVEPQNLPIDVSKVKIFAPSVNLKNYSAVIDDTKAHHKLTLKGDKLKLGYFNGKTAKLKTEAKLLSDDNTNVVAKLDIDTFLPELKKEKKFQNNEEVFSLPFVNPVTAYRTYDLKSNINTKLKIRQHKIDKTILLNGYVDVENTTVKLSGLQLPESYFKLKSNGTVSDIDTNIYVTDSEYLNLFGTVDYGKDNPYIDLKLKSPKVHFANLLNITKAYLDTIHIQNDIANMTASGYLLANASLKTDFKDITSTGKILIRNGNISDKNIGLIFNNMKANIFLDNNTLQVLDSRVLINNKPLVFSGKIDSNSIANFDIKADKIPLSGLYLAFAPKDMKEEYILSSGNLSLNSKVTGEIKGISALLKTDLENLVLRDRAGNFILSNSDSKFVIANYSGKIFGKMINKGFLFTLPKTNSVIKDELLTINIDNKNVKLNKSKIRVNNHSDIYLSGNIKNYLSDMETEFRADGGLVVSDIANFIGTDATPYLSMRGTIPIKALFSTHGKRMKVIVQAIANDSNYITPIKINNLNGKQSLFQFILNKNDDSIKIANSGLYSRNQNAKFNDNLYSNMGGAKEVVSIKGMISNLNTTPFINLFKISIPRELDGSICIFNRSKFTVGGHLFSFGNLYSPRLTGDLTIRNLEIPEIQTKMRHGILNINNRNLNISLNDIDANGSDFRITTQTNFDLLQTMTLSNVRVFSRMLDVDKLMIVSNNLMKSLPATPASSTASKTTTNIPVTVQRGMIHFAKIKSGNIVADNTTGRISLANNVLHLDRLRTHSMGGSVDGNIAMNLATTDLAVKVQGKNFDVEKVLLELANMKDTLSGTMNFSTNITLKGLTMEEQMKTLKGAVDFNVKDGQLGPFGKFENFLMAENLRENAFFSSTIGSVITNIATIDTSHFNSLYGHLTFKDGWANIEPIKSQGNVMSMYIAGKINLLDNSADMKLRAKLASTFSDKLGPVANINPVNLIKNTPGLNVVAAKSFSIFCQSVSTEELKAIPHLGKGKTEGNATKFQVVLHGDTRKPLKMIKSFKWLALDSEIQSAKDFVDTIPAPAEGEEGMTVEELIKLREEQSTTKTQVTTIEQLEPEENNPSFFSKLKNKKKK